MQVKLFWHRWVPRQFHAHAMQEEQEEDMDTIPAPWLKGFLCKPKPGKNGNPNHHMQVDSVDLYQTLPLKWILGCSKSVSKVPLLHMLFGAPKGPKKTLHKMGIQTTTSRFNKVSFSMKTLPKMGSKP